MRASRRAQAGEQIVLLASVFPKYRIEKTIGQAFSNHTGPSREPRSTKHPSQLFRAPGMTRAPTIVVIQSSPEATKWCAMYRVHCQLRSSALAGQAEQEPVNLPSSFHSPARAPDRCWNLELRLLRYCPQQLNYFATLCLSPRVAGSLSYEYRRRYQCRRLSQGHH